MYRGPPFPWVIYEGKRERGVVTVVVVVVVKHIETTGRKEVTVPTRGRRMGWVRGPGDGGEGTVRTGNTDPSPGRRKAHGNPVRPYGSVPDRTEEGLADWSHLVVSGVRTVAVSPR